MGVWLHVRSEAIEPCYGSLALQQYVALQDKRSLVARGAQGVGLEWRLWELHHSRMPFGRWDATTHLAYKPPPCSGDGATGASQDIASPPSK